MNDGSKCLNTHEKSIKVEAMAISAMAIVASGPSSRKTGTTKSGARSGNKVMKIVVAAAVQRVAIRNR